MPKHDNLTLEEITQSLSTQSWNHEKSDGLPYPGTAYIASEVQLKEIVEACKQSSDPLVLKGASFFFSAPLGQILIEEGLLDVLINADGNDRNIQAAQYQALDMLCGNIWEAASYKPIIEQLIPLVIPRLVAATDQTQAKEIAKCISFGFLGHCDSVKVDPRRALIESGMLVILTRMVAELETATTSYSEWHNLSPVGLLDVLLKYDKENNMGYAAKEVDKTCGGGEMIYRASRNKALGDDCQELLIHIVREYLPEHAGHGAALREFGHKFRIGAREVGHKLNPLHNLSFC